VVFACDALLVCACPVHVDFLSAAVNALAGWCSMCSVSLYECNNNVARKHKPHATLSTKERLSKNHQIREPQTKHYTLPTQSLHLNRWGHHARAERTI
jgi:hypothetical protein